MKKIIYTCLVAVILLFAATPAHAQRKTDVLGRGLVVMKAKSGNFLSWRRLGEEYYDVNYNVYRNGTRIATNLKVTNLNDTGGNDDSGYTIRPVVRGVEQAACAAVKPWNSYTPGNGYGNQSYPIGYFDIKLKPVYSYNGVDVTSRYTPNDAEVADLDGDGEMEIIIKRISNDDDAGHYVVMDDPHYDIFEAYKMDGTRLWWIDAGPNMVSGSSTEFNLIAYDWDQDGKAEVLLRGADGMVIHYNGGDIKLGYHPDDNTRNTVTHTANMTYTNTGNEYLIYMNGETGAPYPIGRYHQYPFIEYPLARESASAWGDNYGHRSSKYFMGAPYLNGRKPSIFLGRGIYTRHKMCALDVDPSTHKLTEIWRWECNNSSSPWYGNGYHNYIIADVDEDGRDEIVYGSMVIDDNGKGLSTTGFGHGDAQHVGDLDPYRKGLEFFGCMEDNPGFNYRNATTSQVYYRFTASGDDGRALAANFSNSYPGASGCSAGHTEMISCVADKSSSSIPAISNYLINFRIYWDGDLLSETMGSKSADGWVMIEGPGKGRIFTSDSLNHMNSYTKNVPCFQGDILGDWREEIIITNGTNIRIYTTGFPTEYTMPTLWQDHQYRQAMVWQMHAYNQPPHPSFYLGEMEGITMAPPPQMTNDRTEITNGGTISSAHNDKHVIACSTGNMSISVADGASPWVFTDNAPYWCMGTDQNGTSGNNPTINYEYYTHTVTGGAFTGNMHLTKQGQGTLVLPNVTETYTGKTDVWAGTLEFDGTMQSSPVWLNRFTTLNSTGGEFESSITAEYAATIQPGGQYTKVSTISVNELNLRFGSRVVFDLFGTTEGANDQILVGTLSTESKAGDNAWEEFGPQYIRPVFQINCPYTPDDGFYPIGTVEAMAEGSSLNDILIEGIDASRNPHLEIEDGILYLVIGNVSNLATPTIDIIGWVNYDLSQDYPSSSATTYFLPKVGVSCATTNATPSYSGTFTDKEGNVTALGSSMPTTIYYQEHENVNETTIKDVWKANDNNLVWANWQGSGDHYVQINSNGDRGPRSAYTSFYSTYTTDSYNIEFDMALLYCNDASVNATDNEVVLFGEGASMPAYNAMFGGDNHVFRIYGGKNKSTTYTVAGNNQTCTINNEEWYHYTIKVNKTTGIVNYTITSLQGSSTGGSGHYTISDANVNMNVAGMFVAVGRYTGSAYIDKISITLDPASVNTYAFEKPGTLSLTASAPGYRTKSASFVVELPYVKDGNNYVPVHINDELCTNFALLGEIDGGNSHLWRSGIENNDTWASFVLPYSLSAEQVKSVFGANTVVANLIENAGDEKTLLFETESGAIQANQPFLIKGATNASPYLIKGVSGVPIDEPMVSTNYFQFIGTYDSKGDKPFYMGDYFLTSAGLRRPKADGTMMTLHGYRAYFHTINNSNQAPTIIFDDATSIQEIAHQPSAPGNVYTVTGQLVRTNTNSLKGLPKGIYIIDGKTITVK